MIEILYHKSDSGLDNCFSFNFKLKDYIPEQFFLNEDCHGAELPFYVCLFKKENIINGAYFGEPGIWWRTWQCEVKEIPFHMYYDEEYDYVSFSVEKGRIQDRTLVAEEIKALILKAKELLEGDDGYDFETACPECEYVFSPQYCDDYVYKLNDSKIAFRKTICPQCFEELLVSARYRYGLTLRFLKLDHITTEIVKPITR